MGLYLILFRDSHSLIYLQVLHSLRMHLQYPPPHRKFQYEVLYILVFPSPVFCIYTREVVHAHCVSSIQSENIYVLN